MDIKVPLPPIDKTKSSVTSTKFKVCTFDPNIETISLC